MSAAAKIASMPIFTMASVRSKNKLTPCMLCQGFDKDGFEVHVCKGIDCELPKRTMGGASIPAFAWHEHIVCYCNGFGIKTKVNRAKLSHEKEVKAQLDTHQERNCQPSPLFAGGSSSAGMSALTTQFSGLENSKRRRTTQPRIDSDGCFDRKDDTRAAQMTAAITKFMSMKNLNCTTEK